MNRSRSGDRAAFEQLVRHSARAIFARIYMQTRDVHRSEDLVQETFIRAWQGIGRVSDPKNFRGWLNAIAARVVLDSIKHDARQKRGQPGPAELNEIADGSPGPDESAANREQGRRIVQLLSELPDEYRDVLSLRYLAGADYDEIGRQLAISNGSLRGLLNRGMKMLRERMKT